MVKLTSRRVSIRGIRIRIINTALFAKHPFFSSNAHFLSPPHSYPNSCHVMHSMLSCMYPSCLPAIYSSFFFHFSIVLCLLVLQILLICRVLQLQTFQTIYLFELFARTMGSQKKTDSSYMPPFLRGK